jgi:hypothetical protein
VHKEFRSIAHDLANKKENTVKPDDADLSII